MALQARAEALLGKPRSVQKFAMKREEVWDWRLPPEFSAEVFFNIHFDEGGVVTGTSRYCTTLGGAAIVN